MELYKEILTNILEKQEVNVVFPNMKSDIKDIVEIECYKLLNRIKIILEDDNLDDEECFMKIEAIICLFEELGSDCGNRHDFG